MQFANRRSVPAHAPYAGETAGATAGETGEETAEESDSTLYSVDTAGLLEITLSFPD